jgi:hypothetical protein
MQRHSLVGAFVLTSLTLSGCTSLFAPSADSLSRLPVVTFPEAPPAGDFVFRLPAGKPITGLVVVAGTALATGAEQTLTVTLAQDLYIHKRWISEDGKTWKPGSDALAIHFSLLLPSDEFPKSPEMRLTIDRKETR